MLQIWNGNVLSVIKEGTLLDVNIGENEEWYSLSYDGKDGYVSSKYIEVLTDEQISEITEKEIYDNTFASVDDYLNIRESANKSSKVLTTVKDNSVLSVKSQMMNGWYKVEGNTITGYVSGDYIHILTDEEYKNYSSDKNNMVDKENNIICTYTSKSTYNDNSRHNMHLASDYENGVIVKPGETYSHLKTIHPDGEPNKYVDSYVFVDGKTTLGSGGGVCQTSSTTYAAIKKAEDDGIKTGLVVTAREPHSLHVNYVPRKYEATVSTGSQDFCFRNCNDYSIKIVSTYNYNTLTVTMYKI